MVLMMDDFITVQYIHKREPKEVFFSTFIFIYRIYRYLLYDISNLTHKYLVMYKTPHWE